MSCNVGRQWPDRGLQESQFFSTENRNSNNVLHVFLHVHEHVHIDVHTLMICVLRFILNKAVK